ncbi:MAG: antA/AntB antirepressor family protein [Tannerellaceae bacterium]|jgi:phage anti-repressor protein|nr:antA/AntB antirepressor family protein [Tannerellaceae bacterium]
MNELIPISEHNGKKAVSARVLHEFLESKRDFSNWIKDRINKCDLIENQDYVSFANFGEPDNQVVNPHPKIEYALTLEAAKEISMVEGNAKGKQARRYFIECEKRLNEKALKPLSNAEMFLQSANIMVNHESRLSRIEADCESLKRNMDAIQEGREQALFEMNYLPLSDNGVPALNLRRTIIALANRYQNATQLGHDEVWNGIYQKLYYNYRVHVKGCKRSKGETWLDVAERKGHLEKIYNVLSELVKSIKR